MCVSLWDNYAANDLDQSWPLDEGPSRERRVQVKRQSIIGQLESSFVASGNESHEMCDIYTSGSPFFYLNRFIW